MKDRLKVVLDTNVLLRSPFRRNPSDWTTPTAETIRQSWVWVIPTDKDSLPKEIIELIAKIKKDGPEPVSVSFHGFECADVTFVATVGSSDGLNGFNFWGCIDN